MNVFELFAKIGLDSSAFEKGLKGAGEKLAGFGGKIGSAMAGAAKLTAKTMAVATTAAGGAVVKLTKDAASAYANYEQLIGGVKKLYGDAWNDVAKNAANAFETVGISANSYMETATSFSAALVNSLEGDVTKAAELTDVAMRAMSDNVNTFGSDFESVQNAFMGFSKQNYTMLDNLKLGYGGTKTEMQRLIEDANAYAAAQGMAADLTIDSFADIVQAIQLVQEKQNIAGTTANEAAGTVSGSIGAVKAAWENLVAGLANPDADIGALIDKFMKSLTTFGKNIKPVFERALKGVGTLVRELAPEIASALPGLVQEIAPGLVTAISELLPDLTTALVTLVQAIADQLPTLLPIIIQGAVTLFMGLVNALGQVIDILVPMLPSIIKTITDTLIQNMPVIIEGGFKLLMGLIDGIVENLDQIIDMAVDLIILIADSLIDNMDKIIAAGFEIISGLIEGLADHLPELLQKAVELIAAIAVEIVKPENLKKLGDAALDLIGAIGAGLVQTFEPISSALTDLMWDIGEWFSEKWQQAKEWGADLIHSFVQGIKDTFWEVEGALEDFGGMIYDFIHFSEPDKGPLANFSTYAPDMMKTFADGIRNNTGLIEDAMSRATDSIQSGWDVDINGNVQGGARGGVQGSGTQVITLRLADDWGRIIAEGTADMVSILQGEAVMLGGRGLAT